MQRMRGMHGPRPVTTADADQHPAAVGMPDRGRRPWSLMVVLSVAQFMVILDATVVNVALPSIARSLGFAAGGLQWVVTAYVLASGGLVLLGGRAADVAGRRRIFLAGLALFTAASLASGLAPAAGALIAARAGQGLGAALLTPAALSIITTAYAGAQRATALGVWGAIGGAGAAVGVLAGGILTTWLGWRSVFLVNVPVGVVAGLLSLRLVPRHKSRRRLVRELDLPGAALAVAGLVTVVYALAGAPAHGWGSPRTLLLLALALVLLVAFAAAERSARRPLVPAQIWRTRSLAAGVLVMLGATGILVGTFFLNSLYLQDVQARLGTAGGPGVPPARPGDRGGRPPRLAAAAAGRVTGADRRGPGADGRRSAPAHRGVRRLGLPDRLPAWPARGGDGHRPGVPGHHGHRDERRRRRSGGARLWPDDHRA